MNHKDSDTGMVASGTQNHANNVGINKDTNYYKLHLSGVYDKTLAIPDDSLRKMVKKYGLNRLCKSKFSKSRMVCQIYN